MRSSFDAWVASHPYVILAAVIFAVAVVAALTRP